MLIGGLLCASLGGCGHAPPPASPKVVEQEAARRDRLPEDNRTADGTWDNLKVAVSYEDGEARAAVQLRQPKLRYFYRGPETAPGDPTAQAAKDKAKEKTQEKAGAKPEEPSKDKDADQAAKAEAVPMTSAVPEALRKTMPFDIESVAIYDGEASFVDLSKPAKPELWISDLEVSLENVASRPRLADERPVLLEVHAKVQRSGDLAVFVSADPWSDSLNFSGRAALQGLATRELYGFLADTAGVQMPEGTLDLYVAFTVKDGHLTGGVKPILKNTEVRATSPGFFARSKAWLADHVLSLFSDRVPARNAVATVVRLDGSLEAPRAALVPALIEVLYNAYLRGLAAGFGGLPPAKKSAHNEAGRSWQ